MRTGDGVVDVDGFGGRAARSRGLHRALAEEEALVVGVGQGPLRGCAPRLALGRADGEVLALLREGLQGASRTSRVDEIRGEFLAIDTALGRLQPGDLCLILIDQVEEALEHIARRVAE
jgi:hypothetical protein